MVTFKKLSQIDHDVLFCFCVWLTEKINDLNYEIECNIYNYGGKESRDVNYYNFVELKKYKSVLNRASKYLEGEEYYVLSYCNSRDSFPESVREKTVELIREKFDY